MQITLKYACFFMLLKLLNCEILNQTEINYVELDEFEFDRLFAKYERLDEFYFEHAELDEDEHEDELANDDFDLYFPNYNLRDNNPKTNDKLIANLVMFLADRYIELSVEENPEDPDA